MKPEESQTPEQIDEWLEQIEPEKPTVEQPENLSVDLEEKTEVQGLLVDAPQEDATVTPAVVSGETVNDPVAPTSESTVVAATPLVAETTEPETQITSVDNSSVTPPQQQIAQLQTTKAALEKEIADLQVTYGNLQAQLSQTQTSLGRIVQESLSQLEQRKQALQIAVEQLERRQERIRNEMRTTFAGASQDLAIRVQGFKDYLTGSLQDLAAAAEQLQLVPPVVEREKPVVKEAKPQEPQSVIPQFAPQQFQDTTKQIRRLIDQYRNQPDYYGSPWQLRRTFEPVHAERVSNWFFSQGGRGALRTMGSRLQNTLVAAAGISILHKLYGDRVRTLVLANTPERLGEWRRGLQDCLGIGRSDFGPDRGVVLFEAPEALAQKADRLVKANQLPLIIIDDSEEQISLSLLQFPLWLAFAPDPKTVRNYDDDY